MNRSQKEERPGRRGWNRWFGDLRVRPKLMFLHNIFFLALAAGVYFSAGAAGRLDWPLLAVLAVLYAASVLLLELVILPAYVYRPLRLLLQADEATQRSDTAHELIDPALIAGDELGQIMRSRNAAIAELRRHEADLIRKNYLLETAKRNLADQDRLVSLGLMSASVAHELNTPLAVLHGSIEKLMETVPDRAAQERLARMMRVTRRLQKISEGLLDFARVREHGMGPVALARVIEEAWALVAIDEKAGAVRCTREIGPDHAVIGNSDRLVQVFVNLLRNALNAVKSDGTISVHSRIIDAEAGRWVEVAVEDNGPGIPAGVLPHIFEAFVTSRLDARGTGLGLTVAEGIVHQHGGTIEAVNREGGGARLAVRLPGQR